MAREKDRRKFVELAEKRVGRALRDIRLIGNLSNRSNYKYTEEDAKKICRALKDAVEEVRLRFERRGDEKSTDFRLDS
jgi:hypothetical protein